MERAYRRPSRIREEWLKNFYHSACSVLLTRLGKPKKTLNEQDGNANYFATLVAVVFYRTQGHLVEDENCQNR